MKFEGMAGEATEICLRVLKESNKSRFDSYRSSGTEYRSYPILPFGIVACTFFPITSLEVTGNIFLSVSVPDVDLGHILSTLKYFVNLSMSVVAFRACSINK